MCLIIRYYALILFPLGFPGGSDSKVSACNAGDPGSIPGKIPWRGKWQSIPALLPGKSHGWSSLIGYSPWGHKESDTTERLHFTIISISLHTRELLPTLCPHDNL